MAGFISDGKVNFLLKVMIGLKVPFFGRILSLPYGFMVNGFFLSLIAYLL